MSENKSEIGSITWADLTVNNGKEIRDFYSKVVGWKFEFISMGDYSDYCMLTPETGTPASGICHSIGVNAGLPPQWLIYINVTNLTESISSCKELGGKVLIDPKNYGDMGMYSIIEDPAGAVCALFQAK